LAINPSTISASGLSKGELYDELRKAGKAILGSAICEDGAGGSIACDDADVDHVHVGG